MLLAIFPVAFEFLSARPDKSAKAFLLVVDVLSVVDSIISPCEFSFSFHLVIDVRSLVLSAIWEGVSPKSMKVVIYKRPFVALLILPGDEASAIFLAAFKVTFKGCSVS